MPYPGARDRRRCALMPRTQPGEPPPQQPCPTKLRRLLDRSAIRLCHAGRLTHGKFVCFPPTGRSTWGDLSDSRPASPLPTRHALGLPYLTEVRCDLEMSPATPAPPSDGTDDTSTRPARLPTSFLSLPRSLA